MLDNNYFRGHLSARGYCITNVMELRMYEIEKMLAHVYPKKYVHGILLLFYRWQWR